MPTRALPYLVISTLLWALIPTFLFPNPPLDVAEGYAWGRELALGYTKHPPLPSWLLEAAYQLTGGHVFGAYWLSAGCLALGYLCLWKLGRRLGLSPWQVGWGLMLTSVTFYFTLPLPEFNHNIAQIPIWAAMMLTFHVALDSRRLGHWLLLGLLAAIGLYTKYFVALLIGSIGLYCRVFPQARQHLRTFGPYGAALLCLVLLVPHILWLVDTDGLTLRYAASRSHAAAGLMDHIVNPLNFLGAQIGNHAGLFIILAVGFGTALPALIKGQLHESRLNNTADEPASADRIDTHFLLWFAFLPLSVVLLASTATGAEFEHMWGTPMFLLSGFLATTFLPVSSERFSTSRAFAAVLLVQGIFLAIITGQAVLEPQWKTKHTRLQYPGREIALALQDVWHERTGLPFAYVAGDMWTAANITTFAPDRPHMIFQHDLDLSPWIDAGDLQKNGVMIVWRGGATPPQDLLEIYPDLTPDGSRSFTFAGGGTIPPVTVNWTFVPAGQVHLSPAP